MAGLSIEPVLDKPGNESNSRPATYGVFVYGSMVSPAEISSLLGHPARERRDYVAASLHGWKRRWSVCTDNTTSVAVRYYEPGSNVRPAVQVLFLNVERTQTPGAGTEGVLIFVQSRHLLDLDARERNYDRVVVTLSISVDASDTRPDLVWTYVGKPRRVSRARRAISEGTARIRTDYVTSVRSAFARSERMLAELEALLSPPPAPVANLVRVVDGRRDR
ncbi:MAG TPA: gamma-glutamylcyclotransferase family protein [Jiangellaceae bacterium]|nr:gamma-glutamylcyclotransferase family protein [Jiangellaceae bacterium]